MRFFNLIFIAVFALLLVSCNTSSEKTGTENTDTAQASQDTAETLADRSGDPPPGQLFEFGPKPDFAGSHILIGHSEAALPNNTIERTKEEALEKANALIADLKANPAQFTEIAKTESDGPSGKGGGSLGAWQKGRMVPEFDQAIETLEVGSITDEPVETQFGYHIIRRDAIPEPRFFALEGFVVAFKNPRMPNLEREPLAAEQLANEIGEQLTEETFESLGNEHNDLGKGIMPFGTFKEGDATIPEAFVTEAKKMHFGEVAGPVQLPMGYAFFRRLEVSRRAGSHILVTYKGSESSKPGITKTKEEAEAFAQDLLKQVQADPAKFNELAKQHSDDGSSVRNGDLGEWWRGEMVPPFELALDELETEQIYPELVESQFGYHIIRRNMTQSQKEASVGLNNESSAESAD